MPKHCSPRIECAGVTDGRTCHKGLGRWDSRVACLERRLYMEMWRRPGHEDPTDSGHQKPCQAGEWQGDLVKGGTDFGNPEERNLVK